MLVLAAVLAGAAVPSRAAMAQEGSEVLRGRVTGPDGKPVAGAEVRAIALQSKLTRTTKTNDKGVYTILFNEPEGQYVVTVRALGLKPSTQRVLNTGQGSILVTDFPMSQAKSANELETVSVTGASIKKKTDDKSVGGDERDLLMDGALFSLDPSDLSTFMSNIPGVQYTPGQNGQPGTYSVLGAGEDENATVIDGLNGSSSTLPISAIGSASMATTSYDASQGGFSGGQMRIHTRSGTNVTQGNLQMTLSNPSLSWKDPHYLPPQSNTQNWNGYAAGPVIKDKIFYMAAFQASHSTTPLQSILNLRPSVFDQYGLIADTVTAVTNALQGLGVPIHASGMPNQLTSQTQSGLVKFDMNPTATTALSLTLNGSHTTSDGSGTSAMAYPANGSGSTSDGFSATVGASTFHGSFLNEFAGGVTTQRSGNAPYLALPGGSVLISSQSADNRIGLSSLQFGGGASGTSRSTSTVWQLSNKTSWLSDNSKHRVLLSEALTLTHNFTGAVQGQFGTFSYQTLQDLENNTPTSYSRMLSSQSRNTSAVSGAVSLGDTWQATPALRFEYGLRLDLARSGTQPGYNPVVDSVFGRRTDDIPHNIGWSPRFGFNWTRGGASVAGPQIVMTGTNGYRSISSESGFSQLSLSGGIGAFRSVVDPGMIAGLVDATGLPNTIRQLTCVGAATPIPDWAAYASNPTLVPDQCLDGTAPSEFSADAPSVQLFDPTYQAPLSWDSNLDLSGIRLKGWNIGLSLQYRRGFFGTSTIDLNLNRTPQFHLADEANRTVYVPLSAIVPTTGAIAPGASRISPLFSTVQDRLSDLHSSTQSVTWSFTRAHPFFDQIPLSFSYTWSRNRQQYRGASVADDPFQAEWSEGLMPMHTFTVNTYFNIKWFTVSAFINVNSGTRYTPIVSGDVNGDGQGPDRAYVFDPSTASDPVLASQMTALLTGAPSLARDCLKRNLGQLAGYNSCRTGWLVQPNINFGIIDPSKNVSFTDRVRFRLVTQNALSAVMRLLRIDNNVLAMSPVPPDATLLYVTGFDATNQRFNYRVNQQFGETRNQSGALTRNVPPPFQVNLVADVSFGGTPRRSFSQALGLVPSKKDSTLTRDQIFKRLHGLSSNPADVLLAMSDSLLLTQQQVADIKQASVAFITKFDDLMTPVADYVEEKGHKTDDRELMKRIGKAQGEVQKAMLDELKQLASSLSDEQRQRLPTPLQTLLTIKQDG